MNYETPHDDTDWTNHPDAHPDLSHCPSCGEAVPDSHEGDGDGGDADEGIPRCEQCDRDLRLPRYAIKDQLCLCCKVPSKDADDSIVYSRLETGERICSNCTADLRAFKYEVEVQTFLADWVSSDYRDDLNAALFEVADAHEKDYSFTANANARYGRMEPIPDGEQEITLEAVLGGDMELKDEALTEAIESAAEGDDGDGDDGE